MFTKETKRNLIVVICTAESTYLTIPICRFLKKIAMSTDEFVNGLIGDVSDNSALH